MAHCPRCEELKIRIQELEEQLATSYGDQGGVILKARYDLTPNETAVLMMLIKAGGRPVQNWFMIENLPARRNTEYKNEANVLRVIVHSIRSKVGPLAIETAWGHGYRLTPSGLEVLQGVLKGTTP